MPFQGHLLTGWLVQEGMTTNSKKTGGNLRKSLTIVITPRKIVFCTQNLFTIYQARILRPRGLHWSF